MGSWPRCFRVRKALISTAWQSTPRRLPDSQIEDAEVTSALADFDGVWEALAPREQARILALRIERIDHDGQRGNVSITFRPTGIRALAAELARLGRVIRARLTQIMNLLNLAPDIQDHLLHLPRVERGRDSVTERDLRPIAAVVDWSRPRRMWRRCPQPARGA